MKHDEPAAEPHLERTDQLGDVVDRVVRHIEPYHRTPPVVGIILGTGAGELAQRIDTETTIPYADIPGFPTSTVIGHSGNWIVGRLNSVPIVAMQGRFHLYEGWSASEAAIPIEVIHRLGVRTLLVTNAAGGLNPLYRTADLMVLTSHLDLMFRTGRTDWPQTWGRPNRRSDQYDQALIDHLQRTARRLEYPCHRGTYAAMLGPTYETRAEYRMLRRLGADAAGMSTVPEVNAAARHSMRVLALSIISNTATPDALQETSGEEVVQAAATAAPVVAELFAQLVASIEAT